MVKKPGTRVLRRRLGNDIRAGVLRIQVVRKREQKHKRNAQAAAKTAFKAQSQESAARHFRALIRQHRSNFLDSAKKSGLSVEEANQRLEQALQQARQAAQSTAKTASAHTKAAISERLSARRKRGEAEKLRISLSEAVAQKNPRVFPRGKAGSRRRNPFGM